ncbi:hypothetical protein V2W45_1224180, partial [Cenococcum geophilum]
ILRRFRAKDNKANKITIDNKWEIYKILEERITKLGLEYKVYKSGLLNTKHALKSYKKRV